MIISVSLLFFLLVRYLRRSCMCCHDCLCALRLPCLLRCSHCKLRAMIGSDDPDCSRYWLKNCQTLTNFENCDTKITCTLDNSLICSCCSPMFKAILVLLKLGLNVEAEHASHHFFYYDDESIMCTIKKGLKLTSFQQ